MIASFKDDEAERIFARLHSRRYGQLQMPILRKLLRVDSAVVLEDLRVPPGNRLEALRGDRVGQHSIRVNDQFRICFVWREGNAYEVEIADYH